jgi:hypothetical protein
MCVGVLREEGERDMGIKKEEDVSKEKVVKDGRDKTKYVFTAAAQHPVTLNVPHARLKKLATDDPTRQGPMP